MMTKGTTTRKVRSVYAEVGPDTRPHFHFVIAGDTRELSEGSRIVKTDP
jgi:hypothetical protein